MKHWGIENDPFLRCGCETKLMAMSILLAVSFLFTTLAIAKMRDAQRENVRLVSVVENLTLNEK